MISTTFGHKKWATFIILILQAEELEPSGLLLLKFIVVISEMHKNRVGAHGR